MAIVGKNQVMEYRKLGETSLELSILGFGTSTFGDVYGAIDPLECSRAVALAIDEGINFFDCSPYYGRTLAEERLGQALRGKRTNVIVSTKCGRYGFDSFDFSAKRIQSSIDESLERLNTDHVDLLLAHDVEFGDSRQIVGETIPALREIQRQGKARFIGITGYPTKALIQIAEQAPVDAILSYCHYNLMTTNMDKALTPFAKARGIGLINASALHMGVLTERGAPDWHPAPVMVREAAKAVAKICRRYNQDIAKVAIRFCLDHPTIASTLVGMATVDEVRSNLQLLQMQSDPILLREIREAIGPAFDNSWPSGRPENND